MAPAPATPALPDAAALTAVHAIGRLDGALASSSIAALWLERAAVIGLADCLHLAGVGLTPVDFFRLLVGLQPPRGDTTIDHSLLLAVAGAALPQLGHAPTSQRLIDALARQHGRAACPDWPLGRVDTSAIAAALRLPGADVGTALGALGEHIGAARGATALHASTPAVLCMIAAAMPGALAAAGITTQRLPCLTGLRRSPALYAERRDAIGTEVLHRLGDQAAAGLTLLRRLEACAAAWQARLHGRTGRSRTGQAAALFLIWPALTRGHVAQALGVSLPGARLILGTLIDCDILIEERLNGARFYVAPESLADFKLAPRQGRHRAPPRLPGSLAGHAADVDAALRDLDRLVPGVPVVSLDIDEDCLSEAYLDQPSGWSPG